MKIINKIKQAIKKSWKWIVGILGIIGGIILSIIAKQDFLEIGKVGMGRNWKEIPGKKDEVLVKDKNNKWVKVKLPYNYSKGKQYTIDDIQKIGLSHTIDKGVKIEIKHKPVNRRIVNDSGDSSMSL